MAMPAWTKQIHAAAGRAAWDWSGSNRVVFDARDASGFFQVYTMDPDGGNVVSLTSGYDFGWTAAGAPAGTVRHVGCASWSPDGQWIIFTVARYVNGQVSFVSSQPGRGLYNDIWIMKRDGTEKRRLWSYSGTSIGSMQPFFNHAGTRICWVEMTAIAGTFGTWVINHAPISFPSGVPTLGNVVQIDACTANTTVEHFNETHGFTADDTRIVCSANPTLGQAQTLLDICTILLDGTGLARDTKSGGAFPEPSQYDEHGFYNPAGTKLAWMSSKGRGGFGGTELRIGDADGSNNVQISYFNTTNHPHYVAAVAPNTTITTGRAAWSPDGKRMIVNVLPYDGTDATYGGAGPMFLVHGIRAAERRQKATARTRVTRAHRTNAHTTRTRVPATTAIIP